MDFCRPVQQHECRQGSTETLSRAYGEPDLMKIRLIAQCRVYQEALSLMRVALGLLPSFRAASKHDECPKWNGYATGRGPV
jgi:hypothetical protein